MPASSPSRIPAILSSPGQGAQGLQYPTGKYFLVPFRPISESFLVYEHRAPEQLIVAHVTRYTRLELTVTSALAAQDLLTRNQPASRHLPINGVSRLETEPAARFSHQVRMRNLAAASSSNPSR